MNEIVIKVQHLGKQYRIGEVQPRYQTLRDALAAKAKRFTPSSRKGAIKPSRSTIWALEDVTFDIQQGEVVGIIGRNGAGKSTLLKVLAHITNPTKGRVEIRGRVGSLLEVGTGFHPELTGRENIYLNGAILGMRRAEIERKFDEIVNFAEIEKFLDTPAKHYSSGMYVRLAFAVAAHLEPEILLVDEVLAVGDAEFQKKCLGKMGEVAKGGRTVLFVSHNMGAVRNLCSKCMLLVDGHMDAFQSTEMIIKRYLSSNSIKQQGAWIRNSNNESDISIREISVRDDSNLFNGNLDSQSPLKIRMCIVSKISRGNVQIHIRIVNHEGIPIFTLSNHDDKDYRDEIPIGKSIFEVTIPGNFLRPDTYSSIVAIMEPNIKLYDIVDGFSFTIDDTGNTGTIQRDGRLGVVTPIFKWERIVE